MTKIEFLEELRSALKGEVPDYEMENNISFYSDYITKESLKKNEESVLELLGNPRLIAKTIIEAYQVSHGPIYNNMKHNSNFDGNSHNNSYTDSSDSSTSSGYENYNESYTYTNDSHKRPNGKIFNITLNWFQKIILVAIIVIAFVLFIILGSIFLRLFFTYFLPILLVYILIKSITNRNN